MPNKSIMEAIEAGTHGGFANVSTRRGISSAFYHDPMYIRDGEKVLRVMSTVEAHIRTQPEYHLRMFKGDSTDPNAMATSELPKIPTTKERVLGILTNPIRQVKKAIDRREIFIIAYICTKDLNQRIALDTLHLSARTRKLVQLLWLTLPASYTNYIHHEGIITQFSPRGSTCQRKYSILKDYFDVNENLVTICRNVRANLDLIRYIYSNVHAEIFYASDDCIVL